MLPASSTAGVGPHLRHVMRLLAAVVLSLHVACSGGGGGGGGVTPGPDNAHAPNILFILTDDQDDISLARMAQVQALIATQGARFLEHYVSLSLCCPSRVSTLRGQFAHNTSIYGNNPPEGGFEGAYAKGLEASTTATWLQARGYRTALFGKYLNGYPASAPSPTYVPPGWNEWVSPIAGSPYKGFNYTMNENGTQVIYGKADADYMTDVLSSKADDFIRRTIDQFPDKPFFVYLASYAPHSPSTPAPRHANAYPGLTAPRGAAFNEADVSDKPAWVQALPLLTADEIADIDARYRSRQQSLLAVDEMVARLVETLRAKGQLDNTYIFFTSDNGYHLGQHRLQAGKMTGYEEDLKVPLLVRGPGVGKAVSIGQLTANVDYAATFAEIAGASLPATVDGRSLLPLLKGQTPTSWRQVLLLEHKPEASDGIVVGNNGIREPSDPFDVARARAGVAVDITAFNGLRSVDGLTYIEYATGEHELYQRSTDPSQLNNQYNLATPTEKARLASWLGSLTAASGAVLRQAELAPP